MTGSFHLESVEPEEGKQKQDTEIHISDGATLFPQQRKACFHHGPRFLLVSQAPKAPEHDEHLQ